MAEAVDPMTIEQVIIHRAAAQGGVPAQSVSPATHYQNDLHFDSLDAAEFAMNVEDALHVNIPSERVPDLTTVQMVIDYVKTQKTGE
jgi:acyl carrier protein